ncbi:MAG: uroporphyrinogen decarboxylase family protein [Clostridiales bacterium]|nr:uroporphyrinogen decarboxylase family protein [Clostridiales bacterium]
MNSKEVINAVLNHRNPDYIPLGTYAIDCDTAEKVLGHETYVRNKIKIQIALWEGRRDEVAQSLKEDSVELFRKLDCIDVIIPFKEAIILPPKNYVPAKIKKLDDKTWENEDGCIYQYSEMSNDIAVVKYPEVKYLEEDFSREPEYIIPDESIFEAYDYLLSHMKHDRFMAGVSGGFNVMPLLGGMENGLMEYYFNPELLQLAIQQSVKLENFLDQYYIRDGVDQIFVEIDPATTTGPLLPPEKFRGFCLPAMKQRIENIKKYRDKVMLHSCGNTWKLMDMFIEAGIDCNQSLQTGAGMDIKRLKEEYGRKMCFWGGASIEKLIMGTMEEVREDVRYAMQFGSPEGGFILGPSHSIAYGVKYDNFMAMLDEHSKLKYSM